MAKAQFDLFGILDPVPEGLDYRQDLITPGEEKALL